MPRVQLMLIRNKDFMLKKLLNLVGPSKMQAEKQQKYILMTYRSNIVKVMPNTYYDSDSGWGCMLRVGQMVIANLLYMHESISIPKIIKLFWDNSDQPFSIQQFTQATVKLFPQKKMCQWYNPSEMAFIIKDLLQQQYPFYEVKIFLDNCIFLSEIPTTSQKLLVIILIRIGLQQPQQVHLSTIDSLMNSKYFFGALGGTPKHAHFFVKSVSNQIGYLDPHKTLNAAANQQQLLSMQSEYVSKLSWIKSSKIDSSMGLIFNFQRKEIEQFWSSLQSLKQKHKQNFFLYMDKVRPQLEQGGIIEIDDFQ